MKKILALVLALTMVAAMAACTPANNNETTGATVGNTEANTEATTPATTEGTTVESDGAALTVLNAVWTLFPEENKFPVMGGDAENPNWEGPGAVTLPGAEGNALWNLYVPDEQLANFTEAATMIHAMNANTFTAGALKLAEGADATAVAAALADAIMNTRWMCGFPERMIIVSTGDCLVVAFGHDGVSYPEGGKLISLFLEGLQTVDAEAKVLHDEAIG